MRLFTRLLATSLFLSTSLLAAPVLAAPAQAQSDEPVTVMVLGTYHFGNPGMDLNNMEADDVLSDRRQAELAMLNTVLLEFQPTVIALESQAAPPYRDTSYETFTLEQLGEVREEAVQIGYRLAHSAGVERVYSIDEQPAADEPDYFPFGAVAAHAEATGRMAELQAIADMSDMVAAFETAQRTASIPELLVMSNDDEGMDQFYWDIIAFGDGETQPGADLAAGWFLRNAKIFNKLQQVTQPGDRVVVIYGSGHNHWLRELVDRASGYELEPVLPYLQEASDRLNAED